MSDQRAAGLASILTLAVRPATGVTADEAAATVRHLERQIESGKALTESQRWVLACCKARADEELLRRRAQAMKDRAAVRAREYAAQQGIELDGSPLPGRGSLQGAEQ